ncbi:MAG: hypothetical protein LBC95_01985 [Candidatus Nomurabacteria bacterium]|jgi:hypothetical protein|nr:hypothetical protein [Candidatus Nomurabacteria bacterium]
MKKTSKLNPKPVLWLLTTGAVIAPVQSALAHGALELSLSDFTAKVQAEQHTPHHFSSGSDHYYADPRSIRAVGYDAGKSDRGRTSGRDNWDTYNQRSV